MIRAHAHNALAKQYPPEWRDARPPAGMTGGRLRSCMFCGSMHPTDVANALARGAVLVSADWKYGWPHKFYADKVPNPHAGLLEVTAYGTFGDIDLARGGVYARREDGRFDWWGNPQPAPATVTAKFYTEHLQDAEPAERQAIEAAMGLRFDFESDPGLVKWTPLGESVPAGLT